MLDVGWMESSLLTDDCRAAAAQRQLLHHVVSQSVGL